MASSLNSNHLLLSTLAKRQRSKNPLQAGFTLIELLVVIIIIGILAAVALPAFLNQSDKAKANSAKSLVSAAAKECQAYLVDPDGDFDQTTGGGGNSITLVPGPGVNPNGCVSTAAATEDAGTWTATVEGKEWTYTTTVLGNGTVEKTCAGTTPYGCDNNTW